MAEPQQPTPATPAPSEPATPDLPLLGLLGFKGRLGSKILEQSQKQSQFKVEPIPRDAKFDKDFKVIIDVSKPEGTAHMLTTLLSLNKHVPVVIGVTGDLPMDLIHQYSQVAPTALISNFGFGIPQFVKFLGVVTNEDDWKISMVERHHIHKVDKPSGTAKTLASCLKSKFEIDAVREGEIIGDHDITFESDYEKLTICHHAKDRALFAAGALRYAAWLPQQPTGLYYGMEKQKIHFSKYEGAGNDFVFLKNSTFRTKDEKVRFVQKVCCRGTSIGADGTIFVEKRNKVAYWEYYNADGSLVAMCGNGARCVARYSLNQGWDCDQLENSHGIKQKFFQKENKEVCVEMPKIIVETVPEGVLKLGEDPLLKPYIYEGFYTLGVPHSIFRVEDINLSPNPIGEAFKKFIDVNTNIYKKTEDALFVRTYERGVYDETLACGSGCCSVAHHLWSKEKIGKETNYYITVKSGLIVTVNIKDDGTIYLAGPARKVFDGTLDDF